MIHKPKEELWEICFIFSINIVAPAGFWPRRPKPEEAPQGSSRIRDENFAVAAKTSIFQEQCSQRIAEKYAKGCRNFAGGRINPLHFIKKAGAALVKIITTRLIKWMISSAFLFSEVLSADLCKGHTLDKRLFSFKISCQLRFLFFENIP